MSSVTHLTFARIGTIVSASVTGTLAPTLSSIFTFQFSWYGIIIVTGALTFTGGGEKNITGGVLAGEMTSVEVEISGNAAILYCSEVWKYLRNRVPAFKIVHWRQLYGYEKEG